MYQCCIPWHRVRCQAFERKYTYTRTHPTHTNATRSLVFLPIHLVCSKLRICARTPNCAYWKQKRRIKKHKCQCIRVCAHTVLACASLHFESFFLLCIFPNVCLATYSFHSYRIFSFSQVGNTNIQMRITFLFHSSSSSCKHACVYAREFVCIAANSKVRLNFCCLYICFHPSSKQYNFVAREQSRVTYGIILFVVVVVAVVVFFSAYSKSRWHHVTTIKQIHLYPYILKWVPQTTKYLQQNADLNVKRINCNVTSTFFVYSFMFVGHFLSIVWFGGVDCNGTSKIQWNLILKIVPATTPHHTMRHNIMNTHVWSVTLKNSLTLCQVSSFRKRKKEIYL